jgi:FPC/CPF motif-containing protein YcgG
VQSASIAAQLIPDESVLKSQFADFVADAAFPCLGAKAAFHAEGHIIAVYDSLGAERSSRALGEELERFVHSDLRLTNDYATFVAIFREPRSLGEEEFERLLWSQLSQLHRIDAVHHPWDPTVASDPSDPHFSFSFAGQALYVVGLHAGSSRLARRFAWPTLVFNPHEQFERLRHDGKWRRMQRSIRARDIALQGSVNPMLSDFGEQSEARQYSGRVSDENWRAPFQAESPPEGSASRARCPFAH